MNRVKKNNKNWWRGAVIYQIYPRSFNDTSGNGVGDLQGITEKLPYIADLGVDGIWISPFLKSPQADYGYDIADYYAVDPLFGNLDDFKTLLEKAHDLGLKLIMDMVLSHTSDRHAWFNESKQDRTNPKADWYVWADPKPDGSPPNNWQSVFGGPAWQYYPLRGQYYLHNFLKEQPDLNYHNPDVMEAMLAACRHWLDFGVDGFRLDAVNFCMHDPQLRDNPPKDPAHSSTQLEFPDAYSMQAHIYSKSQPENIEFMRKIRALLNEYEGRFALAEIGCDRPVETAALYTCDDTLLHTAYSFDLMANKGPMPGAQLFKDVLGAQKQEPGDSWPSWAFSNHDVVRAASRWSGGYYTHIPALSKMLPVLLASLRGTAFLYQGDELGLPEADIPFERLCDPWGQYLWPKWQGRDGCRTPIPWSAKERNAGFSRAENTWLPIPETHLELCVANQEEMENSALQSTRRFLNWRKDQSALIDGDLTFIDGDLPSHILAFTRENEEQKILCVFNLSGEDQTIPLESLFLSSAPQTLFSATDTKISGQNISLPAYGYVFVKA